MKRLFTIIISSILLLSFAIVSCEKKDLGTASIYGIVTDKATGEPIKTAGVELLPVGLKTITGTDGRFEFANLKAGSYQVYITQAGYVEIISSNIELSQGQSLQRDVQMELLPPALRVVNDSRKDISELDFGSAETDVARSFNLFNDGAESLEWEITFTADWVKSVSKTEGVLKAGGTQALIVTIDRTILTSGTNTTTLHITSSNGSKQLTLKVVNGTILATLNTLPATNVRTTTAVLNGEILTEGSPKYTERGFVYSLSSMPTVENTISRLTATITDSKKYSVTLTNLTQNQTYYVRAYAVNAGKYAYSTNEVSFTPSYSLPKVTTDSVTNIVRSLGRATFVGTITDAGEPTFSECGFVYGLSPSPKIGIDKSVVSENKIGEIYSLDVQDLELGNTYYVRAYVKNLLGVEYGEAIKFDFVPKIYEPRTLSVTNISLESVTFQGCIDSIGDPAFIEKGFVWSELPTPLLENSNKIIVNGISTGNYSAHVNDFKPNAIYYVSAYVKYQDEVKYGDIIKFVPPFNINGKLEDVNGKYISGAFIAFNKVGTKESYTAITDDKGNFNIKGIRTGSKYEIIIKADGYSEYKETRILYLLDDQNMRITLSLLGSIKGVVVDDIGTLLSGVKVSCGTQITTTNTLGEFFLTNLEPGSRCIDIEKSGYSTKSYCPDIISGYTKEVKYELPIEKKGYNVNKPVLTFNCQPGNIGQDITQDITITNSRDCDVTYTIYGIPNKGIKIHNPTGVVPANSFVIIPIVFTCPSPTNGATLVSRNLLIDNILYSKSYVWPWEGILYFSDYILCDQELSINIYPRSKNIVRDEPLKVSFIQNTVWR